MDRAYYTKRMIDRLPGAMQTGGKISALFDALDQEMNHMDRGVKLLMKSRWFRQARGWYDPGENTIAKRKTELGQIAAMFGLLPGRYEPTESFRQRLFSFIQIHREGLGNAKSILQLVALVYRAKPEFEITYKDNTTAATLVIAGANQEPDKELYLELAENPVESAQTPFIKMEPGKSCDIVNEMFESTLPSFIIKTDEKENKVVSVPMLIHKESGIRILYIGKISPGSELHLQSDGPPKLLREDALQYGGVCYDTPEAIFDTEKGKHGVRFGGARLLMTGQGSRFNRVQTRFGEATFASFGTQVVFPALKYGKNHWTYRSVKRNELELYLQGHQDAEELLHNAEEEEGPPIHLKISWRGRRPACFSLRFPGNYVPPFMENFKELQVALTRMLEYGRAAGIQARLEPMLFFKDTLHISDRAKTFETELLSSDELSGPALTDEMGTPFTSLTFEEKLQLSDQMASDGRFNLTHLNHSTFVDALTVEKGRFNKDKFNQARYSERKND